MTSRTRTTCPLNQRGAAGGYEKMPPIRPIPWVDHYLANEVLVDDFSPPYGNWSPPPAGSRLQLVDDPIPYLIAPTPPTPPSPSTSAETPPSADPDRPA